MSVLCSKSLIFAPEWWKCTLREPPGTPGNFFPLHLLQSFCCLLRTVLKTMKIWIVLLISWSKLPIKSTTQIWVRKPLFSIEFLCFCLRSHFVGKGKLAVTPWNVGIFCVLKFHNSDAIWTLYLKSIVKQKKNSLLTLRRSRKLKSNQFLKFLFFIVGIQKWALQETLSHSILCQQVWSLLNFGVYWCLLISIEITNEMKWN